MYLMLCTGVAWRRDKGEAGGPGQGETGGRGEGDAQGESGGRGGGQESHGETGHRPPAEGTTPNTHIHSQTCV